MGAFLLRRNIYLYTIAKAKKEKETGPRPENYERKFAVKGNFFDVFKVVKKNKEDKKK